jgi:dipeptidyl aminopeptidase/acylaminoacyl peptidase
VVFVHDGPAEPFISSFNPDVQFLANQGYFVIAPNYRGTAGYGTPFLNANHLDMGGGDLQDVLAAADWIVKTGYVDPKKLIVMGSGYGGYLTMMAVTKAPATSAAAVAIAPSVNWVTKVKYEDPLLREYDLANMGDPEKNRELWQSRSPVSFADRAKAPMLLLAGGNDRRYPKEEAQQMADAVHKSGGKVELKVYENEGHQFVRTEDKVDAWKRIAGFLKFYVPAPGCGQAACEVQ